MKILRVITMLFCAASLSACGGGSNSNSNSGGGGSTPAPSLNVSLSSSSGTATVEEGATTTTFTATATSSDTVTTPVVVKLDYDAAVFSSVTAVAGSTSGTYAITATTKGDLGGDTYTGAISFRLCQDAACTKIYAGSSVSYTYSLTVKLHEWATFQRDAAHTGYVNTTLDPSKFKQAWTWANPENNPVYPVISANGSAFVSARSKVYSFNEATGAQNWVNDLSLPVALHAAGGLAYNKGTVYVPALVNSIGFDPNLGVANIRGMDAATGNFRSDSSFETHVSLFNSPTIFKDEMFYADDVLQKYTLPAGTNAWIAYIPLTYQYQGAMPAVDDDFVYYNTAYGLGTINKKDGSNGVIVADNLYSTNRYENFMSPVIAPSGHVIYGSIQQYENPLVAVDVGTYLVAWRSAYNYNLQPVVAGSVVYGMRNNPLQVDAISDVDGKILWSWPMPAGDTRFEQTMVVCDNLLFVSTDKSTYAIDLKTHQTVWATKAHGDLSLSSGYILYIAENDTASDGSVVGKISAIKLRN